MTSRTRRLALLLLVSGTCAVVYQTAWLRLLRLIFGASTAASAAVLAIFMGGLGLGAWLFGRRADRSRQALELYALLEIGVALLAAASPLLIDLAAAAYRGLGGTPALGFWPGTALRLLLTALVIGPPAVLMGGTLPAAVRAGVGDDDRGRRALGLLYGINTLGAVLGALGTTFFAIEFLGTRKTIWIAALVNLLLAMAARALARADRRSLELPAEAAIAPEGGATAPDSIEPSPWFGLGLLAAAVSGFVFFLMELVWYRMLGPILGGSSYTFGLILAIALLGIGLGGLLYGFGERARRPTLASFAGSCALEALAIAVPFALGDRIAFLAYHLRPLGAAGFGGLAAGWLAVTALVVLPAAIVAGYQFPLLVALAGAGRRHVGREVGLTYAWNTAGAILGSLAGGFGLLPLLSAPGAWKLAVLLLALLALLAALAAVSLFGEGPRRAVLPAAVAVAAAALLGATGPTAVWRHNGIGAGRGDLGAASPNELRAALARTRGSRLWEEDGRESSVALMRGEQGLAFYVNGKSDGSARGDAPTQVMGGLVGAALHPEPRSALVIGLGTGSTAGWLAAVDSIERVEVVELEPAITEVARQCAAVNRGCLANPKVRIEIADGREMLLTSRNQYDIIFSEPSNPYRAGISSLFTREFYQAAARSLAPGGYFLQWLQGYDVDATVVRTAYATLSSVFPLVESWEIQSGDLLLVASAAPRAHDLDRLRQRLGQEPFATALEATWGVSGIEGFFTGYVGSPALAQEIAREAHGRLNTDDRPRIEFGFIRNLGRSGLFSPEQLRVPAQLRGWDRPPSVGAPLDWDAVVDLRGARTTAFGQLPPEPVDRESATGRRTLARRAFAQRRLADGAALWLSQQQEPRSHLDLVLLAAGLARAGDPRAPAFIEKLRPRFGADADAALALWHYHREQPDAALSPLLAAIARWRGDPWASSTLASAALGLARDLGARDRAAGGRLYRALEQPFAVHMLESERRQCRIWLARRVDFPALCAPTFTIFEPHPPWIQAFLEERAACYRATRHPLADRADADLEDFGANLPPALLEREGQR